MGFSWKPQRPTGPAEEKAFQLCSSSLTKEPILPTGTRLDEWIPNKFWMRLPLHYNENTLCGPPECIWWNVVSHGYFEAYSCPARNSTCHYGKIKLLMKWIWCLSSFKICTCDWIVPTLNWLKGNKNTDYVIYLASQHSSSCCCENWTLQLCRTSHPLWSWC